MSDNPVISMSIRAAFAVTLGILFLIEGIWGLFDPMVFGFFSTNRLHAVIHLVLGVIGVACGRAGRVDRYLFLVGLLLFAVGALWFLPGANEFIVRVLNVNRPVASLNIVVGVVALFLARPRHAPAPAETASHHRP